ncbi:hypothetical protein EG028_26985 [Chitinophaga barathri]|uniref:PKD domain-containing protein n=2 Tax=Chitinophaga barathri TaxID=1647451 RepID=A0A3N4M4M1_9BACT|nr:hypothetical protein EG028_26985 [Chitinophaga barathri]
MAFGWMAVAETAEAQCNWSVQAVVDSSRCAASGKITASLTGPDKNNVTNLLYKLKSADGLEYPEVGNPSFENLPAGTYELMAKGVCNSQLDSSTIIVTVPGNYVAFSANGVGLRNAFRNCNTGQAKMSFFNGRKRYRVSITGWPAAYQGEKIFYTQASELVVDSLPTGNYTFILSDSCGSSASPQSVTIGELPTPTVSEMGIGFLDLIQADCNKLSMAPPSIHPTSPFYPYVNANSGFKFGVAWPGNEPAEYVSVMGTRPWLNLPAGQTMKDIYGQTINYYIKSPCGEVTILPHTVFTPSGSVFIVKNCSVDFGLDGSFGSRSTICLPISVKVKNRQTEQHWDITLYDANDWTQHGFPYGSYDISILSADSAVLYSATNYMIAPDTDNDKYTATVNPGQGIYGLDRSANIRITIKPGQVWAAGSIIELVSPATHRLKVVLPTDGGSVYEYAVTDNQQFFKPGVYTWKVTDRCGSQYITTEVKESDVYKYDWSIAEKDSCNGKILNITKNVTLNGQPKPTYYAIVRDPSGVVWNPVYVQQGPLLLQSPGEYRIGISAYPYVPDYYEVFGRTENIKFINYTPKPLAIDPNLTAGYICPQGAPNSGSIVVRAINGILQPGASYQFKLAAAGNGFTGPYLDSNYVGRFNSGSSYSLMVNQNYDVKIIDGCGASIVQTVRILDYATAQLALLDKEAYCVGDIAKLNVLQLPSTAIKYRWTFPDGSTDTLKAPIIRNLGPQDRGVYHVAISADICQDTIRGQVTLDLADFERICYSAVTDTSVNPYTAGLLGNWRAFRAYSYYGARKESDPNQQTNTRTDGTYADFITFWQKQQHGWKASQDTTRWVWTAESTLFNKKGFELENKDPLGRYNTAIYGFEDALAVAAVQNSRYREAAFEGFEDYDLSSNICETGCYTGRRFDFSSFLGMIDSTQRHTGRYSIRIAAGDTMFTSHTVTDVAGEASKPVFQTGAAVCTLPGLVLKAIKADSTVLLPPFSPLAGKKVLFSAWVKEQADCNCNGYTQNVVKLVVKKGEETFIHTILPSGNIIEGWQRYEYAADVPQGSTQLSVLFIANGTSDLYIDDIRLHPYNANMKSYVYDPMTLRMMAELDENNYATFFEYDDDGVLIRVKKETERGIKTIKETRSALVKE